jgi:malonyl-CoA O-methyltransferase
MLNPSDLDQKAIALRFERLGQAKPSGRSIDRIDFYLREVERRMLERLSWTKLVPANVLDIGCGRGHGVAALQQLFPQATVIGADLAFAMMSPNTQNQSSPDSRTGTTSKLTKLFAAFKPKSLMNTRSCLVQADSGRLPFSSGSVDLIWSNLMFHWLPDAQISAAEWYRVIRPNGLLSFTALGVDTFKELRGLGLPLMALPDMHDIGDLLVKSGFSEPVMDQQKLALTYTDASKLIEEIASFGGHCQARRGVGLKVDKQWKNTRDALESLRGPDGKINLTTEIVFGHTWCPPTKKRFDGWAPLEMKSYVKK